MTKKDLSKIQTRAKTIHFLMKDLLNKMNSSDMKDEKIISALQTKICIPCETALNEIKELLK